jgi:hypothetical protein
VGNDALATLFSNGFHNSGRLGWPNAKSPLDRANVEPAADAHEAASPNQTRERLIHGRTGSKMQKFFRRDRHPFGHLANVIDHGCCEWFHVCQKYITISDIHGHIAAGTPGNRMVTIAVQLARGV